MSAAEPVGPALALSVLLHAAALAVAIGVATHHATTPVRVEGGASWSGDTFDVDELLPSQPRAATESSPAAAPTALPETEPEPKAEPEPKIDTDAVLPPPKPRPKPRVKHPASEASQGAPPASASAAPGASSEPAPAASGGSGTTGGQSGSTPSAPANLAKAFTKAITAATNRNPLWDGLSLGEVGAVEVVITVDDEGHITASSLEDEKHAPESLQRLVKRTLALLQAGRFALSKSDAHAGSETLRIQVTLSSGEAEEDYDNPGHTVSLGFDPPTGTKPGRAYFVHASGRHFDARVTIVK